MPVGLYRRLRGNLPPAASWPGSWNPARLAGNPILTNTGGEPNEMYNPGVVRMAGATLLYLVKGAARIYEWTSNDDGSSPALANAGSQVIGPGAGGSFDSANAIEPVVLRDGSSNLHAFYKGGNGSTFGWGHATAPVGTPTVFTKDAGNPILTSAQVSTALGGGSVTDLAICDVVLVGSTYHFYGYTCHAGVYKLIRSTGAAINAPDPTSVVALYSAPGGSFGIVETPSVFRMPGAGSAIHGMWYSIGDAQPGARYIRLAKTSDIATAGAWDFSDATNILSPTGSGWEQNEVYSGHLLKESASPWLAPDVDSSGQWRYAYSGLDSGGHAQSGLVFFKPSW